MLIVWNQKDCTDKAVMGYLYLGTGENKTLVYPEKMNSADGIRTWLFSDLNDLEKYGKAFENGTYTIEIVVDEVALITKQIVVKLVDPEPQPATAEVIANGVSLGKFRAGEVVTLPALPTDPEKKNVYYAWAINGNVIEAQYTVTAADVEAGTVEIEALYYEVAPEEPEFEFIGAGFYTDATAAKLALAAFGSSYTGGVDDNTMLIVWAQSGYSDKTIVGKLLFNNEVIFTEEMNNTDGVRTWLFSDANDLKKNDKAFQNGTYTIEIVFGDDVLITKQIVVKLVDPEPQPETYVVYAGDLKIGSGVAGTPVALPSQLVDGTAVIGWKVGSDSLATISGYYYINAGDADQSKEIRLVPVIQGDSYDVVLDYDADKGSVQYTKFGNTLYIIATPALGFEVTDYSVTAVNQALVVVPSELSNGAWTFMVNVTVVGEVDAVITFSPLKVAETYDVEISSTVNGVNVSVDALDGVLPDNGVITVTYYYMMELEPGLPAYGASRTTEFDATHSVGAEALRMYVNLTDNDNYDEGNEIKGTQYKRDVAYAVVAAYTFNDGSADITKLSSSEWNLLF